MEGNGPYISNDTVQGTYHDWSEVLALEAVDCQLQRLVEGGWNPLGDEPVQVDGAAEELKTTSSRDMKTKQWRWQSRESDGSDRHVPGRGAASAESRSGWRPARECWPLGSYSQLSNACPAEDWWVPTDRDKLVFFTFSLTNTSSNQCLSNKYETYQT